MAWDVPAQPEKAIEWFRERVPMTDDEFAALEAELGDQAFTVAGVAQLDVVTDVWEALDTALDEGTTIDDFLDAIGDTLEASWGGSVDDPGSRIETIFRTNLQTAYGAGRFEQMTDPDVVAERPYWMFDAIHDSRTTEICQTCDGVVVAADDSWWSGHYPPCHFNCRSVVTTLTEDQAKSRGITARPPSIRADDGFGHPRAQPWAPSKADYPQPLWNEFEKKTGTGSDE